MLGSMKLIKRISATNLTQEFIYINIKCILLMLRNKHIVIKIEKVCTPKQKMCGSHRVSHATLLKELYHDLITVAPV